jgi:hypothetical protein
MRVILFAKRLVFNLSSVYYLNAVREGSAPMVEEVMAMGNGATALAGCNRPVIGTEVKAPRPARAPATTISAAHTAPRACTGGRRRVCVTAPRPAPALAAAVGTVPSSRARARNRGHPFVKAEVTALRLVPAAGSSSGLGRRRHSKRGWPFVRRRPCLPDGGRRHGRRGWRRGQSLCHWQWLRRWGRLRGPRPRPARCGG